MENQDYSHINGGQPVQSSPSNPAVGSVDYWNETPASTTPQGWEETSVENTVPVEETVEMMSGDVVGVEVEPTVNETVVNVDCEGAASSFAPVPPVNDQVAPPPYTPAGYESGGVGQSDVEGLYEAINSVFEKVEKFQDIIKIQNRTIDRFSKGVVLDARKSLLMEVCDLYETVLIGINEDDRNVEERVSAEERCRYLRSKLDELTQFIECTLEDYQVEIKFHPNGTETLEPYQTVTGREMTTDISRFANFDSDTNVIYTTDRRGYVLKATEVTESGACKQIDHILRPEEVTKVVLKKD